MLIFIILAFIVLMAIFSRVRLDVRLTKGKVVSLIIIGLAVIIFSSLIEIVPNGHRGIKYNINGGVEDTVLNQGWHLVKPTLQVTDFPIYLQNVALTPDKRKGSEDDDSFYVPSKDGKQVKVGVEMNYKFDENMLPEIWQKFGGKDPRQIEDYHIKGKLKAWTAEATAEYPIIDLYGEKRTEASQKVLELLRERFAKDGIIVESFNFTSLTPDKESLAAIQDRVDAQQRLETAKIEKQQKEVEAETKVMEAEAKAKAKIVEAEGEKKANELMQKSLTPALLEQQWIEKWNGELPQVSGDSKPIINLTEKAKEEKEQ